MKKVLIQLNILFIGLACSLYAQEEQKEIYLGADTYQLREDISPHELDVVQTYNEAVALEKEVTELYKEICAAKLSRIQRQSLRKSLKQTVVPLSERLMADVKLLRNKSASSTDVEAYQEELQKIMQENNVIVANAEEMLSAVMPEQMELPEASAVDQLEEMLKEMEEQVELQQEEKVEEQYEVSHSPINEQMQKMQQKSQEKMDRTVDALKEALVEMKLAEIKVDKKIEEMKQEEKEKQEQKEELVEEEKELVEENLEDPEEIIEEEQTEEEKQIEELKENLEVAKNAVQEAIEAIEKEEELVEEKIEQAREALEKIEEILGEVQQIEQQMVEQKIEPPLENIEKVEERVEEAKKEMKAAAEMLLQLAKLEAINNKQLSHEKQIAQQQVLGELAKADTGEYLDLSEQMKGYDLTIQPIEVEEGQRPPDVKQFFKNVPGRKVVKTGGTPTVWFYVDSWYLIGPYDNTGRMNLQKVYPPESIVDLDANYFGKYNAQLSWAFDSFGTEKNRPIVTPHYGRSGEYTIFYGYTELYFEEAMDLWIVVGSDDRSDLWINDLPVWHSRNELKIWQIDEGYRKVHFKKGINKIVFRLENGWNTMEFSLLINTMNPEKIKQK